MKKYLLFAVCFCIASVTRSQQVNKFSSVHSGFAKNLGQVVDEKGHENAHVKFLSAAGNFNVALKENGFSYEGFYVDEKQPLQSEAGSFHDSENDNAHDDATMSSSRIDVIFKGANPHPAIIADQPSESVINYFLPHTRKGGITAVPVYNRITYKNLYNGIDLVFSFNADDKISPVEYSFIIHPGADASRIKMQYNGAEAMYVSSENDLNMATPIGTIAEKSLKCFVQETSVPLLVTRSIENNTVRFETTMLSNQTIVIDPNIVWGSYYGGENYDYVGEVKNDKQDKVIISGCTASTSNISTNGAYQTTYAGGTYDILIAKFKDTGKMEWATYFGGNNTDIAYSVTTDNKNNIIVVGKSQSGTDITTTGAYQETNHGGGDMLVAKFTKGGILTWCTLIGAYGPENFQHVICDSKGNIFAGGYTECGDSIKVSTKNPSTYHGEGDAFLAKFSSNGFPSWSAYFGGEGQDRIHGLALDQFGNVYLQGTTESVTGVATAGTFQSTYGGNTDAFIAKMDSTGNLVWGSYYGGTAEDHGRGVVCGGKAAIYIVGYGASAHKFGTNGVWQKNINSEQNQDGTYSEDGFVAKFSYAGSRLWGTYYGGRDPDELLGIDMDDSAHVYVGGVTSSGDSIALPNGFQQSIFPNTNDGYFAKFDTTGKMLYASYIGGPDNERVEDITIGNSNNLYLALTTYGKLPVSPGVWQTKNNGDEECAVYRFNIGTYCYDSNEPNETQNNAKSLTVDDDTTLYGYTANISGATDQDWYSAKTTNGKSNLKVVLTDLTKVYTIQLYNAAGNLLASSVADGADQVLIYNTANGATYSIKIVHDALNFDTKNCYRIQVWKKSTPFVALDGGRQFNIAGEQSDLLIQLYPNPVSRQLNISGVSGDDEPAWISIYNMVNEIVYQQKIKLQAGEISEHLELPELPAGTYLFEWKQKGAIHRQPLSVQ